jgi:branched-chain amino acid transport system substrate-binding protein
MKGNQRMRIFMLLLITGASLLTVFSRAAPPERPVRIGLSANLSGELSQEDGMYLKGVRLFIADVNARGGILGRKVELVVKDDGSQPGQAARAYGELTVDGGADLLLGPADASLAPAVLPVLARNDFPCVFPVTGSDSLWKDGTGIAFGVQSPLSEWTAGFFEVVSRSGLARVALLRVDLPEDDDLLRGSAKWARRYGLEPVLEASCAALDLPSEVSAIARSKAEAVVVWGSPEGCAGAVREIRRSRAKLRALFMSTPRLPEGRGQPTGRELDGVFTALPWEPRLAKSFPGGSLFVEAFRAAHGQDPDALAASAFAGCQVLEAAAVKAQSLDRQQLRQALAGLDTLTVLGRYGVDPAGMQLRQFPLTLQWQKGRREIVWPEELRTARPVVAR